MRPAPHRRNRLAVWYEEARRPGLLLAAAVLIYTPFLFGGFVLDDLRNIRLMREYHAGERPSLDLYRFLNGDRQNHSLRQEGRVPWWVEDGMRYRHFRPLTEWFLYGEYLLFGERAIGYRLVSLGLYALGAGIVLALFRCAGWNERTSRWAALLFVVASSHAIPASFVASQCDLLALLFAAGATWMMGRYLRHGGTGSIILAVMLFITGLFSKEVVLATVFMPIFWWLTLDPPKRSRRRLLTATCVLGLAASGWLLVYLGGGYGSNAVMMLDPFRAPGTYLATAPWRTVLLLSSWIIPVNPFMFQFHHAWNDWLLLYGAVGIVLLAVVAVMFWRHHRSDRTVRAMALWVVPFLPLLACTLPDDRVMMLPSIGLAYLGAAWMTRPRGVGDARLRALPFVVFFAIQVPIGMTTGALVQFMEREARGHLEIMLAGFGREPREGDHIFFLNSARNFETLFTQERLRSLANTKGVHVSVLSDIPYPKIEVVDPWTLRMDAGDVPFFSSFVGHMGTARDRPRRTGDALATGEFEGRVVKANGGVVSSIELRFRRPLTSDAYRFYWSDLNKEPAPWRIPDASPPPPASP